MATRQITVQPDELPMMLLAALTTAHTFAQHGHLEEVGRSLVRAGELLLALKEAPLYNASQIDLCLSEGPK